ncbi:MAG: flagellar motor switch protein FliM [Armatimonadota bacterium]
MLQQSDINALLNTLQASQESGRSDGGSDRRISEVKLYDFARPDNLPSEFIRALDNINAVFARAMAGMLTGYLSMGVQVEPISIEQMSYRQFCSSVPEMTAIITFAVSPLDGTALLEMNPHLAWYLIDRGLGGKGEVLGSPRDFTLLEKGLLEELFRRILRDLNKAWESLAPLRMTPREIITNPTIARVAHADDRMVVCSFNIAVQEVTAMSTYCIPVGSLDFERLLDRENSWEIHSAEEVACHDRERIVDTLHQVPMDLHVCLPDITLPLGELASLRVGDVIHFDAGVDSPVEVRVENHRCFLARPTTLGDTVVVELVGNSLEVNDGRLH